MRGAVSCKIKKRRGEAIAGESKSKLCLSCDFALLNSFDAEVEAQVPAMREEKLKNGPNGKASVRVKITLCASWDTSPKRDEDFTVRPFWRILCHHRAMRVGEYTLLLARLEINACRVSFLITLSTAGRKSTCKGFCLYKSKRAALHHQPLLHHYNTNPSQKWLSLPSSR